MYIKLFFPEKFRNLAQFPARYCNFPNIFSSPNPLIARGALGSPRAAQAHPVKNITSELSPDTLHELLELHSFYVSGDPPAIRGEWNATMMTEELSH